MYGYNKYAPLDIEEVFKRVSEKDIFRIVIPDEIIMDKGAMYVAPYRNDNNPNCYFTEFEGKIWFTDFASPFPVKSMDCIQIIKICFNVSFIGALEVINKKLNLGLGDNLGKVKDTIHDYGYVEEKTDKRIFKERIITYLPRNFNYKDKQFWEKYGISKENLIQDKVIPIDLYRFTSKKGKKTTIRPLDICYAYTGFVDVNGNPLENKVKIYRPYAGKGSKWLTNCNQNIIGSIQYALYDKEILIISKSYKDCRVLRNLGLNAIWFQNEGMLPSKKTILELLSKFKNIKRIVVWFDNDSAGIANSRLVSEYINTITKSKKSSALFLPPKLGSSNITDPSDYLALKGEDSLISFIKKNELL